MRYLMTALFPLMLVACGTPEAAVQEAEPDAAVPMEQRIAEGRAIADAQCANCHGLDKEDALRADAPPLRHVLANYDADILKEDFEGGLKVGHPDMPFFVFGPLGAEVLLDYLKSIQEPVDG